MGSETVMILGTEKEKRRRERKRKEEGRTISILPELMAAVWRRE